MNTSVHKKSSFYFLIILLVGMLVLILFILRPFLSALILATVFSVVSQPLYKKISMHIKSTRLASLFTSLIVAIIILVPSILLGRQIFRETWQLYSSVASEGGSFIIETDRFLDSVQQFSPVQFQFSANVNQYLKQGLSWLVENIGLIFSNIGRLLMSVVIFLIAFYYLLKDGKKLMKEVISLSPLADVDDSAIFRKLGLAINSVIKGNLIVAIIQGTLTAIGFAIFGIPHAILWGSLASVAALIPGFGTALVITPAILFLFVSGEVIRAVGLLIWGVVAVGLIDNFLGPKLVGQGLKLHPFLVFLSVLGGIGFFGPIGFLLGPLILSLFFALLDIHNSIQWTDK
ncbi:MAG: AI-2E family transporter [bacterium]|nr:AI-2E family transporter [bacterium]